MNTAAAELVETFSLKGLTIATAESLTAGLVSAGIADVPGASVVLRGGACTYATETKARVLGVSGHLLAARGPVDPEVAHQMARGAARVFQSDVGVATTGVAGPSEQDGKAVGTVFVSAYRRECQTSPERYLVQEHHFDGSREEVRSQAAQAAWLLALNLVDETPPRR